MSDTQRYRKAISGCCKKAITTKIERRIIIKRDWAITNSPFEMLDLAFKRLFPNIEYTAYFYPTIRPNEDGNKVYGLTNVDEDGSITIYIDTDLSVANAVEIFAHELAHAGVGVDHEHDEVWEKAFDDLFDEYNRIAEELFKKKIFPKTDTNQLTGAVKNGN